MKQNIRRSVLWFEIILLLILSAIFTGGCKKQEAEDKKTVLTFSWWGDEEVHRATLEAIRLYEELHPEIEIKAEFQYENGYFQRIATQMANGNLPDIFQYRCGWYEQTVRGALSLPADLEEMGIDFTGVEAYLENSTTLNGKVILYPLASDGDILLVNRDFFRKYGIPVRDGYTWNQIMELGLRVHEQSPTEYLLQVSLDEVNEHILPIHLVQQISRNMISAEGKLGFTSRQMTHTMETIKQLYDTGTIAKVSSEAMITSNEKRSERWDKGKAGIRLGNISTYTQLRDNLNFPVAYMSIPRLENAPCSGIDYQVQSGLSISSSSMHPSEAAEFLQWFTGSEEAAAILGLTRGIPANQTIKSFLMEKNIIDDEILDLEGKIKSDAYIMNSLSRDEEFKNLRKDFLIQMLEDELLPKETAWKLMVEWVGL